MAALLKDSNTALPLAATLLAGILAGYFLGRKAAASTTDASKKLDQPPAAPATAAAPAASPPAPAQQAPAPAAAGAAAASTSTTTASQEQATAKKEEAAEEEEGEEVIDLIDWLDELGVRDSKQVPRGTDLKQVICVNDSLGMSKGKVAAQVSHGSLDAFLRATGGKELWREYVKAWYYRGCAKICLRVPNVEQLLAIAAEAEKADLPVTVIEDAGHTEIPAGSRTVVAIGPAPKAKIDEITGPKGKFPLRLLS